MIIKERIQKADGTFKYRNYLKQDKLGKGGFAQCYLVQRIQDKKQFAIKIIPKKLLTKSKARLKMLSEIKIHRSIKHKNICQLEKAFEDNDNVYMLLQLCKNRNLFQLMKKRKKLTTSEAQYFIYQIIDSLCYLHNRKIVHRDVKLGNLLLNDKMELKLADFGLATKIEFQGDKKHTVCGTPNYIAPQIIKANMGIGYSGHSYQVDIWSTGIILYIILTGKAPFQTNEISKTYEKISKGYFNFPNNFKDQTAKDLIKKILVVDPTKRFTFQQVLQHPFMNPKTGIPKQLPIQSMNEIPKLDSYQKYQVQDLKLSARNASINTLRSQVDHSLQQEFHKTPDTQRKSTSRSSRDVKGLLKSIFSTTSISRSIQKLNNLGKVLTNPHTCKLIKPLNNLQISNGNQNATPHSLRSIKSHTSIHFEQKQQPVYILKFKKQMIWSYLMSNGYVGTYESQQNNYKILYNKKDKIYFEIVNDGIPKKLISQIITLNENITNRKRFLDSFSQDILKYQSFFKHNNVKLLVYLKRVYDVKSQSLILFKLSNQDIQAFNYETNISLLVTKNELILITINDEKQIQRIVQKKDKYAQCKNKTLISMYLKVKKILIKITNMNKQ